MKTRTWKKIGIIFGIVSVILILVIIIIPMFFDLNRYNDLIASEISKTVGGEVKLGPISWGISDGIWLEVEGFSIVDASSFSGNLKLSRIYTKVSIAPLLSKKVVLNKLLLEGAVIKMRLEPGTAKDQEPAKEQTSASPGGKIQAGRQSQPDTPSAKVRGTKNAGSAAVGAKSSGYHLPVEIEIAQLVIGIDRLELNDTMTVPGEKLVHIFNDVKLTASNLIPGREMAFKLALQSEAKPTLGSLKAQGSFSGLTETFTLENPKLKLKAALSSISIGFIEPYLKNDLLTERLGGILSLDVDYEGDLGNNFRAQGSIDFSQTTYTDPSLWDYALPGQKTTLTYQIRLNPHDLVVENLALKIGSLSLNARADVHSWSKDPVIKNAEFSSDLPLVDTIPFIPWKQLGKNAGFIRPIFKGGGSIVLSKVILPEINLNKLPKTLKSLLPQVKITAQVAGVSTPLSPKIPKLENITGSFQLADGIVKVEGLKARIASVDLPSVSAKITNLLEKPKIDAHISGQLNMNTIAYDNFAAFFRQIGLEKLVGTADLDLTVGLETARPEDYQIQGNIELKNFEVKTVYTPALLQGLNAAVAINPNVVNISHVFTTVALEETTTAPGGQFTLEFQGRIDDWNSKPTVTLQNLKTSSISLPMLASIVAWEKLGKSAKPVKEILVAGGTITLEDLALPRIDLLNLPKDPSALVPKVKLIASFVDLTVPAMFNLPKIEGITGRINLKNNMLVANNMQGKIGPLSLPIMNVKAVNISEHPKVAFRAKGPLQVAETGDAQVEKLLMKYGLKSLAGSALIDMSADFDQLKPKNWTTNGSLVLKGVSAETHPQAVVMENLQGEIKFYRQKTMGISAQDISMQLNKAPVRLSGKLSDIGSEKMVVAARVYTKQLNLSHLAEFFPVIKEMKLEGLLDMNVDVHVPYAAPEKSKLKGTLTAQKASFLVATSNLVGEKGNTEIELLGDTVEIKTMALQVNDQQLFLSGKISNPLKPKAHILITSPNLNLDRLLPQDKAAKPSSKHLEDKGGPKKKKSEPKAHTGKEELPPLAQKLTANFQLQADQGQYKGLQFQKLKLDLLYENGLIKNYNINFGIDDSRVTAKGSADLRNPDHILFTVNPDINALELEKVAALIGTEKLTLNGPISLKGQLRGNTGSNKELLASLAGNLDVEIGPGNLNKVGVVGNLFGKILSTARIKSIFSGRMFENLSGKGIPFQNIKAQTSFDKGMLNLNKFDFISDSMNLNSQGTIDLVNEKLNIKAHLIPMATVDKMFKLVPVVGKMAGNLTKIRIDIKGPLQDPKIRTAETKKLVEGVGDAAKETKTILKGVGKILKKLF